MEWVLQCCFSLYQTADNCGCDSKSLQCQAPCGDTCWCLPPWFGSCPCSKCQTSCLYLKGTDRHRVMLCKHQTWTVGNCLQCRTIPHLCLQMHKSHLNRSNRIPWLMQYHTSNRCSFTYRGMIAWLYTTLGRKCYWLTPFQGTLHSPRMR